MTTSLKMVSGDSIVAQMQNLHSINTSLDSNTGIVHVAANVSQNLRMQLDTNSNFGARDPRSEHTLALRPSLQIASQSARDCSEAQGEVSSIYNRSVSVPVSSSSGSMFNDSRSPHRIHPEPWRSRSSSRYRRRHWRTAHPHAE